MFASQVIKEMEESVPTSMNAQETIKNVIRKPSVSTPWGHITVHVNWDLKATE